MMFDWNQSNLTTKKIKPSNTLGSGPLFRVGLTPSPWIRIQCKLKNMIKKSEYAVKNVFGERGVTFFPPYKNFVLEILIRGKMNTERTWVRIIPIKIWLTEGNTHNWLINNFGPRRLLHFLLYNFSDGAISIQIW